MEQFLGCFKVEVFSWVIIKDLNEIEEAIII